MILRMLAVALVWGGGGIYAHSAPWERSVSFQIRGQDCFYSLPLVWPHSQEQLHFPGPTPPCSPLTARPDRVVLRVSAHMHVNSYVCLCVFLSELGSYYSLIPLKYFWKKNRGGEAGSVANTHAPLNLCSAHNETFIIKAPTVPNGP